MATKRSFWKKNENLIVTGTLATVAGGLLLNLAGVFGSFFTAAYAQLGIYDYYAGMDVATGLLLLACGIAFGLFVKRRKNLQPGFMRSKRFFAGFIILVVLVAAAGVGFNVYHRLHNPKVFTVVFGQFDGSNPKDHMISARLEKMLNDQQQPNMSVTVVPDVITTEQQAQRVGKQHHAAVVIRGFYHNDEPRQIIAYAHLTKDVAVSRDVSVSRSDEPVLTGTLNNTITTSGTLTFGMAVDQANAGITQLSMFLVGINHVNKKQWSAAESSFSKALAQTVDSPGVTKDTLQYFRGLALHSQDKFDAAQKDLSAVVAGSQKGLSRLMIANIYHVLGNIAYVAGQYDQAERSYTQALAKNDQDTDAYTNRGLARDYLKKYDAALGDLAKAQSLADKLDEPYPYAHNGRGAVLRNQKKLDQAIAEFDAAIKIDKKYIDPLVNKALVLADRKKYTEAQALITQARELEPKKAIIYYNSGHIYDLEGKKDKAIKQYTLAIKYNPRYVAAYNNRGAIYKEKGDLTNSIKDFDAAIAIKPEDGSLYHNRSSALHAQATKLIPKEATKAEGFAFLKRAAEDAETAIKLEPNIAAGYIVGGQIYMMAGETYYDQALETFNKAAELDGKNPKVFSSRGLIFESKQRHDEALADYNHATKLDAKLPDPYFGRGRLLMRQSSFDAALVEYNKAVEVAPKSGQAYLQRALYYLARQDRQKAHADANRVIELDKDSYEANVARVVLEK